MIRFASLVNSKIGSRICSIILPETGQIMLHRNYCDKIPSGPSMLQNGESKKEIIGKKAELNRKIAALEEEIYRKTDELEELKELAIFTDLIDGIELVKFDIKGHKFNAADCGTDINISEEGFLVTKNSCKIEGFSCVRDILSIPSFSFGATESSIVFYMEVEIIKASFMSESVEIGFCTKKFPLENNCLGRKNTNSIGIWNGEGIWIDGELKFFENDYGKFIKKVVGIGIVHASTNSPMKCFATMNGKLMGMEELPTKFANLQLYPAVSLKFKEVSIRANFAKEKWLFKRLDEFFL